MRRCLLLISLLALMTAAGAQDYLLSLGGRRQYAVAIDARGAHISGICVVKTGDDGSRGTLVNEFGIQALSFTLSANRRKVGLPYVLPAMDRWYIKRVVRADLRTLFAATSAGKKKGRRTVSVHPDGTVVLTNNRFGLAYSLKPLKDNGDETTE